MSTISKHSPHRAIAACIALTIFGCLSARAGAPAVEDSSVAGVALPEAPGLSSSFSSMEASSSAGSSAGAQASAQAAPLPEASKIEMYIEPGQTAPAMTAKYKVIGGLKDSVSPFSAIGWLTSAGYEQLVNGSPNYGTDRGAFGQRLGAAAVRDISEDVFTTSLFSPIFREDPRYYRMGPSHNFFIRLIYSGTRPVLGRTDGGHSTIYVASLAGNLAGAGLTNAYYPQLNRGTTQTMETFGGSLGGAAIGDVVSEFYGDFIHLFHKGN